VQMDFAFILVVLVAVSGVVWALDSAFLLPRRKAALAALGPTATEAEAESVLKPSGAVEYARSFFPVFFAVPMLRSFVVEPFRIPSGSMMPTLLVGDFILVNKFGYGLRLPVVNTKVLAVGAPERGDVVVFRYPEDPSIPYIKRIVGLPGDEIRYLDKQLLVNGQAVPREQLGVFQGVGYGTRSTGSTEYLENLLGVEHHILIDPNRPGALRRTEWTVPEGHFFVLGDNRDDSRDSRFWGFVPEENLVGQAFVIWMNWDWSAGGVDFRRLGNWIP